MDIRVADHLRNRFNIKVRRHQKAYGFTDPPVQQVLNRRESILLFYNVTQVIRTDEKVPRQKAQRKRLHIVCVNISDNLIRETSIGGKILLRRQFMNNLVNISKNRTDRVLAQGISIGCRLRYRIQNQVKEAGNPALLLAERNHWRDCVRDNMILRASGHVKIGKTAGKAFHLKNSNTKSQ